MTLAALLSTCWRFDKCFFLFWYLPELVKDIKDKFSSKYLKCVHSIPVKTGTSKAGLNLQYNGLMATRTMLSFTIAYLEIEKAQFCFDWTFLPSSWASTRASNWKPSPEESRTKRCVWVRIPETWPWSILSGSTFAAAVCWTTSWDLEFNAKLKISSSS